MRCIIWSTCHTQTPPDMYGGIEYVNFLLGKKMEEKKVETWVLATRDSPDPVSVGAEYDLVRTVPSGQSERSMFDFVRDRVFAPKLIPIDDETVIVDESHEGWSYMLKKQNPRLNIMKSTVHGDPRTVLPGIWNSPPQIEYPCLIGISKQQSRLLSERWGARLETAYNGVDETQYPLNTNKREDYLLSLSRIVEKKGIRECIQIANQSQTPLIIAGNDSPHFCPQDYVRSVKMESDGKFIKYIGEVSQQKKVELYQKAKCTLLPALWPEPFGLVAIESILCGTPVVALSSGAYPETITNGEGGFVCNTIDEMVKKIGEVSDLDHQKVRENGLRFSADRMADRYIELMTRCLSNPW